MPKEIAVGICFAAATFIPTVARRPDLRISLLVPALLFAMLCSLNCLFIYAWEHPTARPARASSHPPHVVTRVALRHLRLMSALLVLTGVVLVALDRRAPWPVPLAAAIAAALLLLLDHCRDLLEPTTLRAAADFVLLTPFALVPFLR